MQLPCSEELNIEYLASVYYGTLGYQCYDEYLYSC